MNNSLTFDYTSPARNKKPFVSVTPPKDQKHLIVKLDLSSNDKTLLNRYIISELDLYNVLIDRFTSTLSRDPDIFLHMTPEHSQLFSDLCGFGYTVDDAKKDKNFDNRIDFLNSLPESIKIMFEVAKTKFGVFNSTKMNMSQSVLNFFIEYTESNQRKTNFGSQTLVKCTLLQKRHIQINRKDCKIVWDKVNKVSSLYIPHMAKPICTVPGIDIRLQNWSVVIVHQRSNVIPSANTDWIAEFKPSKYGYILRYVDKRS